MGGGDAACAHNTAGETSWTRAERAARHRHQGSSAPPTERAIGCGLAFHLRWSTSPLIPRLCSVVVFVVVVVVVFVLVPLRASDLCLIFVPHACTSCLCLISMPRVSFAIHPCFLFVLAAQVCSRVRRLPELRSMWGASSRPDGPRAGGAPTLRHGRASAQVPPPPTHTRVADCSLGGRRAWNTRCRTRSRPYAVGVAEGLALFYSPVPPPSRPSLLFFLHRRFFFDPPSNPTTLDLSGDLHSRPTTQPQQQNNKVLPQSRPLLKRPGAIATRCLPW